MIAIAIGRDLLNHFADPHPASLKVFEGLPSLIFLSLSTPPVYFRYSYTKSILGMGVE